MNRPTEKLVETIGKITQKKLSISHFQYEIISYHEEDIFTLNSGTF